MGRWSTDAGSFSWQRVLFGARQEVEVISVFTASSPLLVAGVVLAAGTAAWLNWYAFGLGAWLIAVAAFSGFAGPAGVWAVDALAVGVPFLVMAAITHARSRS
jgi:hypothetical protein